MLFVLIPKTLAFVGRTWSARDYDGGSPMYLAVAQVTQNDTETITVNQLQQNKIVLIP